MERNLKTEKWVAVFSFFFSITGIINNAFIATHNIKFIVNKEMLNPFVLDWVFSGSDLLYNGYNFVNAFFDLLLLIGAILYVTSARKKSRLIRFILAIVMFSNILVFVNLIIAFAVLPASSVLSWFKDSPLTWLSHVISLAWIYLSFRLLKYFNNIHELQTEVSEGETTQVYFVKALTSRRFFNPIIDTIVTICLFSITLRIAGYYDMDALSRFMTQTPEGFVQSHIWLVIIILRIIYYLFFETVLGTTPAKLITGMRVIDYDGTKPSFKRVLIRTLSRLVPFEAFSFFADDGWHDKWSETVMVNEKLRDEQI